LVGFELRSCQHRAGRRYAITMKGRIRIIGGQWRGRRIAVADSPGLRPTGDRARETLFNWLNPRIHGARCLDLFAGSGALGLEAASRGAGQVVLIENQPDLVRALREIASAWPGGERLTVVQANAIDWLSNASGPFDIVFIDPPFDARLQGRVLERLIETGLLAADARVYVESGIDEHDVAAPSLAGYEELRHKRQGEVTLRLLRPRGD
jgi:16S rRNA (guanine966-N2)-methyltransferase